MNNEQRIESKVIRLEGKYRLILSLIVKSRVILRDVAQFG